MPAHKIYLSENELKIVQNIIKNIIPNYEVWAFGSRVKGNIKPYSDLDLIIINYEPLALNIHADLNEAFDESDLTFKVDIIDWATTNKTFQEIILQNYFVLQSAS